MNVYLESIAISVPLALAVMAMLGYVFATLRQRKKTGANDASFELQRDLTRSRTAVSELNVVIREARSNLARHYARFGRFERRAARLGTRQDNGDARWHELCREIEGLATPTLQLVSDITNAQERIRCQSNYLLNFSELRIDPLTGLGNRRAPGAGVGGATQPLEAPRPAVFAGSRGHRRLQGLERPAWARVWR